MNKFFSAIMVLTICLQTSGLMFFNASEITEYKSEVSEATLSETAEETASEAVEETTSEAVEETTSEAVEETTSEVVEITSEVDTEFYPGVGNQNDSAMGQATYLTPNDETEDELQTIGDLSSTDSSKYISVEDLNATLVDEIVAGETLTEGIIQGPYEGLTNSEINTILRDNLTFNGTCWTSENATYGGNVMDITEPVEESDTCNIFVEDYGNYYNLDTLAFEPIDLTIDVNFVDFYTDSDTIDAHLGFGLNSNGIVLQTYRSDEVEFSTHFTYKDGSEVDVPVLYLNKDLDGSASTGYNLDDVYKIATFYQNPDDPTFPESGEYTYDAASGDERPNVFNFESYFAYLENQVANGVINEAALQRGAKYYPDYDRSNLNSISDLTDASGVYEPEDRGWNRIKFLQNSNYITVFDSWGSNSNGNSTVSQNAMYTNGNDGEYAIIVDANTSFAMNMNSAFYGYNPAETATTQTVIMTPYSFLGESIISKETTDESGDGIAQVGEDLTYNISVKNMSPTGSLDDIPVRDSLLENLPSYLSWDGTVEITDATNGTTITSSGSLEDGTFTLDSVPSLTEVIISYTVTVDSIPDGVVEIDNVVTNNNTDPDGACDSETSTTNCDGTETPVDPNTSIVKSLVEEIPDGYATEGEELIYTVTVTNESDLIAATDVNVRDNMLENTPDLVTWDGTFTIDPDTTTYTGDLEHGTFTIDEIPAGESVSISYTVTVNEFESISSSSETIVSLDNIATDNGDDPYICDEEDEGIDCSEVVSPLNTDTIITKEISEEFPDGYANDGETLTYTINVTNSDDNVTAFEVPVRDSLLENIPTYATWDGTFTIDPDYTTYTGDFTDGSLILDEVPAASTVSISYDITLADTIPEDVSEVLNVATDNGDNPDGACDSESATDDCDGTEIPVQPEVVEPIDPQQGDTIIEKSVSEEFEDGYANPKETLTYTIEVTNNTDFGATKVAVRDSMLENISSYVTFNDDVEVDGSEFTGSLTDGNLVLTSVASGDTVTITYSITLADTIPSDVEEVLNVVTDNGSDPKDPIDPEKPEVICPEGNEDCDEVVTPVQPDIDVPIDPTEGNTVITKEVSEEFKDGYANPGEVLTYSIHVTNNTTVAADNVVVRDSMLENLPEYVTFNDDVTTDPSKANTTGTLTDGDFTIVEIASGDTVTITYSVTLAESIPEDISELLNVATDNGDNPDGACDSTTSTDDCDGTELPIQPELVDPIDPTEGNTVITKEVSEEFKDGYANPGEVLTYSIHVTNNTTVAADNVVVRDSMLENLPDYVTFNDDVATDPSDANTTGSLTDGDFTIIEIASGDTVTITYSITLADSIPSEVEEVLNVVTDNGSDPDGACDSTTSTEDCDGTELPIQPEIVHPIDPTEGKTVITKEVSEEIADGYAETGETLTYSIHVTNNTTAAADNVVVRDSMLENLPEYVTFNNDVTTDPSTANTTGTLTAGDFTIVEIASGDTVTITYSITLAEELPEDISELQNVVTDNNEDPNTIDVCDPDSGDCDLVIIPVEGDTVISKSVVDENENGIIEANESLEYTLELSNPSVNDAHDVIVRDGMLENVPSWLTFNNDVTIDPSDIEYTGDFTSGNLTFDTVTAGQTITITYSLTASDVLPEEVTEAVNVVTDNGSNPDEPVDPETPEVICPEGNDNCDNVTLPLEGNTVIEKSVSDENSDGIVDLGEVLTYTLTVTNDGVNTAHDVVVRDSMLEQLPSWLTFNDDVVIDPSDIDYSGSLSSGDLTFSEIAAGDAVTITYSVTAGNNLPVGIEEVVNIATDNGEDPTKVDPKACTDNSDDCASTETPIVTESESESEDTDTSGTIANTGQNIVFVLVGLCVAFIMAIALKKLVK